MKKFAFTTAAVLLGLAPLALAEEAQNTNNATNSGATACCTEDGSCKSTCADKDKTAPCCGEAWLDIETVTVEAANGDPIAQYTVAYLAEVGDDQTAPDTEKAREWYAKSLPGLEKAAEEGHPAACLALARMYAQGKGVEKNTEKAEKYMKMYKEICKERRNQKDTKCPDGEQNAPCPAQPAN